MTFFIFQASSLLLSTMPILTKKEFCPVLVDCFPRWREYSCAPEDYWSAEERLEDPSYYYELLKLIAKDQSIASRKGRDYFYSCCESISQDIVDLTGQQESPEITLNLQYLLFESCLTPIKLAINAGEMNKAYDWLMNSLANDVSEAITREFYTDRISIFNASRIPWIEGNCPNTLMEWLSSFYYYCRSTGALYEQAYSLIPAAVPFVMNSDLKNSTTADALIFIVDWSNSYNLPIAIDLAQVLELLFSDDGCPLNIKVSIVVLFCTTAGKYTKKATKDWAFIALNDFGDQLVGHQKFQVLKSSIVTEDDWLRLKDQVFDSLITYKDSLYLGARSPLQSLILLDQKIDQIRPYVFCLSTWGRRDDLLELFSAWYSVPQEHAESKDVLFLLPNNAEGMTYLDQEIEVIKNPEWENSIVSLSRVNNEALGLTLVVPGETTELTQPELAGRPNYDSSLSFEKALAEHYQYHALNKNVFDQCNSMISMPSYLHPLQAQMLVELGDTLPISVSLQVPERDRKVLHVGLWYAGNDFYSAMEVEAIADVFSESNINCDITCGDGKSIQDFKSFYNDSRYDIVWISGHGEVDRWDPLSPVLNAGGDCLVPLDDLLGQELEYDGRRLLVLNICDGAVAAVNGGIHKIGYSPMLSSRKQATISHLWPVEPRVASVFGLFLAKKLAVPEVEYFEAFKESVAEMRGPWEDIKEKVSSIHSGNLSERVSNFDADTSSIFHWGSQCFLQ